MSSETSGEMSADDDRRKLAEFLTKQHDAVPGFHHGIARLASHVLGSALNVIERRAGTLGGIG